MTPDDCEKVYYVDGKGPFRIPTADEVAQHHDEKWNALTEDLRARIVTVTRRLIDLRDVASVRAAIARSREWWAPYHFSAGMDVRNALRRAGITDAIVGGNLDDYWVRAVEEAVRAPTNQEESNGADG